MSDLRVKQHPVLGVLVSTDGHVMVPATKFSKAHWTLGTKHDTGYRNVTINYTSYQVHRLVLETFVGFAPEGKPQADHINRVRDDNRVENLRWVSRSENQRNTSRHDHCETRIGIHTYDDPVEYNKRNCRSWYQAHRGEINARRRAADKTEINAKNRARYAANPEYYRAKLNEYRRRKKEKNNVER